MRDIKFRGLRADGKWVYGYLYRDEDYEIAIMQKENEISDLDYASSAVFSSYKVFPETVGQFTGLYDKNGKEIYEGDFVEAWSSGSKGVFEIRWRQEGSPCWILYPNFQHREHWYIRASKHEKGKTFISVDGKITTTDREGFYDDGLLIIGNIHENPELCK